jgi:hypothetical protein
LMSCRPPEDRSPSQVIRPLHHCGKREHRPWVRKELVHRGWVVAGVLLSRLMKEELDRLNLTSAVRR